MKYQVLILFIVVLTVSCMKKQGHEVIYPEAPTYSYEGIITERFHNLPLEGAKVTIFKQDSVVINSTTTDNEGYFKFEDISFDSEDEVFRIMTYKLGYTSINSEVGFDDKNTLLEFNVNRSLITEGIYDAPGTKPSGICWDGNNIWTVDYNEKMLYEHNANLEVINGYNMPYGVYPKGLCWDGTNFWLISYYNKKVFTLSEDFSRIQFSDTLFYKTPMGDEPPIDITFYKDTLVACDIFSDQITYHSSENTNIYYKVINKGGINGEIVDPAGIVYTGKGYYIICETSKIILTDLEFNLLDLYYLDIKVGSLSNLDFDGEFLWCIDNSKLKIYKFKNIFH